MKTAKSSSFIAILGATVGFGVYLFIGVKGLFGLFGISSLVLYCGSFMQIISGIMMLANTLGKLKEILPFAADYFKYSKPRVQWFTATANLIHLTD